MAQLISLAAAQRWFLDQWFPPSPNILVGPGAWICDSLDPKKGLGCRAEYFSISHSGELRDPSRYFEIESDRRQE